MVQLVSEYVTLERRGADDHWGRCPFHEEQSPSFHIRPSKGLFKCFGCGKGGDVFSFVEEAEGLSFPEALRRLAEKAGVALEPESPEERAREARLLELRRATALASEFFQEVLWSHTPAGERGRAYLVERGITPETAREFQLGVAPPEWDALTSWMRQRNVVEQALIELGLVRSRDGQDGGRGRGVYDFFRDRFMFPIRDEQGKVCGFGGRTLCGDERKYMNSRELPGFYEKRRVLYGLDMARKARPKRLVVVEGYMDVVLPHQAGRREFVAALGTAFTPEQAKLARRYVDEVVLLFDGDAAGAAATLRALANLVGHPGLSLKVARMPGEEDPDELVRRDPALLEQVLDGAEDVIAFLIRSALIGHDAATPAGRERAIRAAISLLARITDLIRLNAELAAVAERFALPETVLRQELDKARREQSKAQQSRPGAARGGPNPAATPSPARVAERAKAVQASEFELRLLEALLAVPQGAVKVKEQGASAEGFSAGPARRIAEAIFADAAEHGAVEPARVLGRLDDPDTRGLVGGLIAQLGSAAVGGKHKDHEGELAGLDRLMRSSWERRLRELKEEIRRAERRRDQTTTARLLQEHRDLKARLAGGAKAIPTP